MALDLSVFYATPPDPNGGGIAGPVLAAHDHRDTPVGDVPATTNGSGSLDPGPLLDVSEVGSPSQPAVVFADGDGNKAFRLVLDALLQAGLFFRRADGAFVPDGTLVSGRLTARIASFLADDADKWEVGHALVALTPSGAGYVLHANTGTMSPLDVLQARSTTIVLRIDVDGAGTAIDVLTVVLPAPLVAGDTIGFEWSGETMAAYVNDVMVGVYAVPLADRIDSANFALAGTSLTLSPSSYGSTDIADASPGVEKMTLTPYGVAA